MHKCCCMDANINLFRGQAAPEKLERKKLQPVSFLFLIFDCDSAILPKSCKSWSLSSLEIILSLWQTCQWKRSFIYPNGDDELFPFQKLVSKFDISQWLSRLEEQISKWQWWSTYSHFKHTSGKTSKLFYGVIWEFFPNVFCCCHFRVI